MRAIACRIGAESDTPAAAALARKSASSAGDKTGGGRDRAAISHQDAPPRGKGCTAPCPRPPPQGGPPGDRRGVEPPLASPNVAHGVGWLPCAKRTRRSTLGSLYHQVLQYPYVAEAVRRSGLSGWQESITGAVAELGYRVATIGRRSLPRRGRRWLFPLAGNGTVKLSGIFGFWRRNRSSVERRINNLGSGQGAD